MVVNSRKKKIRIDCQLGIGISLRVKGSWARFRVAQNLGHDSSCNVAISLFTYAW